MNNRIDFLGGLGKSYSFVVITTILFSFMCTSMKAQEQVDLPAIEDAFYSTKWPSGTQNVEFIRIEKGFRTAYLKFDLSNINGTIDDIKLQFTVFSDAGGGNIDILKGGSNTWSESDVSPGSAPSAGALLGNINSSYAVGSTYTVTLDKNQMGNGLISLVLVQTGSGTNDTDMASDENTNSGIRPKLVVTYTPPPANINVSSVSTNPTNLNMEIGGASQQVSATISPSNATNQTVSWASSNNAIATVSSNGLVSPVAVGQATITVTTQDGNMTAQTNVTVTNSNVPVSSISTNPPSLSLEAGGVSQQVNTTISPSDATDQTVSWTSNNNAIATVSSNGLVTPIAVGQATIEVTTQDGNMTAQTTVTVTDSNSPPSTGGLWSTSGSNDVYFNGGNVGIGSIPRSDYMLAIAGDIISEKVRVELQSTWPDYVFKDDYVLPTLEEVKKQIQEKGHLLNMPSADEVEANGIELGEMNKLLLEKIEELTLYIIEQDKNQKKLESRIKILEKK